MALGDAGGVREAGAGALETVSVVAAFEGVEDALGQRGLEADAVVDHRDDALLAGVPRADGHRSHRRVTSELGGVREEVLEQLPQLARVARDDGEGGVDGPLDVAGLVADVVYMQQEVNIAVGERAPLVYLGQILAKAEGEATFKRFGGIDSVGDLRQNLMDHAVPERLLYDDVVYADFLAERRGLMAEVVRAWYGGL